MSCTDSAVPASPLLFPLSPLPLHDPFCVTGLALQISGGDWKQELLFTVPRDHPEIERLEGRYKK